MLKPIARWTPGVKACFVEAIDIGLLSEADVMRAHSVSAEELAIWRENLRRGGVQDLRVRTIQLRSRPRLGVVDRNAALQPGPSGRAGAHHPA